MSSLANLIPDPSTASVFVPRPAAVQLTPFNKLQNAGQMSAMFIQGDIVYGMIQSSYVVGCDQPFAYNLDTQQFLPVSGILPTNIPTSQPTGGDWVPPTMDALSTTIIVTHPGFNTVNGYFGNFNVSNPTSPVWSSGNTSVNLLPKVPVACRQFGGRMYYAIDNATVASDQQFPLVWTNATHVITYGDRTPITALGGLPLYNQLGGIIESLIAFKGSTIMYQVTGDFASTSNPLALNTLNVATGTLAPNTICTTPFGMAFVAPDGLRLVTLQGGVSDPIGNNGQGVTIPFKNAIAPSRMCAAFNQNVIRITVQNGANAVQQFQEYWYDFNLKIWTGPHSFPVALIKPWKNTFIAANPIVLGA
jgi:hypothetical protein